MKNSFKPAINKFVTRLLIWAGLRRQEPKPKPAEKWTHAYGDDPAKWDADDWVKNRKEYPDYYDEGGRSYRC